MATGETNKIKVNIMIAQTQLLTYNASTQISYYINILIRRLYVKNQLVLEPMKEEFNINKKISSNVLDYLMRNYA